MTPPVSGSPLALRYTALTDVGLRRSNNQDSGYASPHLLLLADGMGGAAAGDLASSEAVTIIRSVDDDTPDGRGDVDALDHLTQVVNAANQRLGALIEADPAVEGMGTTVEAMLWDGEKFAVAHLGDSRAYRLRGHKLTQLSADHTFVQSLVDEGRITSEEARHHPHRSLLLRAMLGRDDFEADYSWLQPQLGDRYLLCSDGLSDMVEDEAIARALGAESIDVAATDLVRLALEGGGADNVTVVIGEMVDASTADEESELACADGMPQLVGAAAEAPQPRRGAAVDVHDSTARFAVDPEELRYAPREPSRWRLARWLMAIVVLFALIGVGAWYAYQWTQDQYFVSESDGTVAIYRGVDADLPFVTLRHLESETDIEVDDLSSFQQSQVRNGIEATDLADAEQIVRELRDDAAPAPSPTPSPTVPVAPTIPAPATVAP
ncbi:BofC C-terminal domain-containing protein [Aeromicrobium sp. Sec7.5]|uniref:BofC C-terminal domain-containing protein n=1 Tax=Aeromicrobium sp. Sec7.5 TaxID=3121276 RepID=UPI002FE44736